MQFELNGEPRRHAEATLTVRSLIEALDLGRRRVAVAINAQVVPRSRFDEALIHEGDRVELIHAVGGG